MLELTAFGRLGLAGNRKAQVVALAALTAALAAAALAPHARAPLTLAPSRPLAGLEGGQIDESGLRYYWGRGESERLKAEIARLHRLYPQWTTPAFLNESPPSRSEEVEDERDLWALFAADRIDELAAAIARRRAAEPGWRPSHDLLAKFEAKKLKLWVADAAGQGRYAEIARRFDAAAAALDGADIDLVWTVAEAYQQAHRNAAALALYKRLLERETDPGKRRATVQKALGGLSIDEVESLVAMGRGGADGRNEFAALNLDLARARIAAFLHDELRRPLSDEDLKLFSDYARTAADPNEPALLAWRAYKLHNAPEAMEWFKLALARGGDAMVAHGLALTMQAQGRQRETEEVAYAWRKPLVNNAILFIDVLETDLTKPTPPRIEPERLARYAEVTEANASGEGAQALAWYAYNSCQFEAAEGWFERAVAWFPKQGSVYGLALSLRKLHREREANELINRYDGLFPALVGLLFPDDLPHPPTPCETAPRRPDTAAQSRFVGAAVQVPLALESARDPYGAPARLPKIPPSTFPISVDAENPYRAAPAGRPALINAAVGADAPAAPEGFAREPAAPAPPQVARRVPGVGSMPYERYGFTLLPAYNGETGPSGSLDPVTTAPSASERFETAPPALGLESYRGG